MKTCFSILTGVAALCLAGAVSAQPAPQPAPKTVIYKGAALIDGTGTGLKPNMAIVIKGATIEKVVPTETLGALPTGAKVVDMHEFYALPGLINSHVHLSTKPNRRSEEAILRRDLYGGVTAVRDMAGDGRRLADLARSALLSEIPAPDIYYAAFMAGPEFFNDPRVIDATRGAIPGQVPWMQAITEKTDLKIAVAEARGTYATGIKIYADLPGALVKNIVAEAHRQGILVWTHSAIFPATPKEIIEAGADVVSHVCMLAYQASDKMPRAYHNRAGVEEEKFKGDNRVVQNLFEEMKRRGTILDATLWVYDEIEKQNAKQPKARPSYCSAALADRLLDQAYRSGVLISAGTDGESETADLYPALQDELELLVRKGGMKPMDAIRSATLVGAMTVGHAKDMGTIEPGKLANLVFVAKNPLDDIANLKSVVLTVKRGVAYLRSSYHPIQKDEVPEEQ